MSAAIFEVEPGALDQVVRSLGDHDFAADGCPEHPSREMHRNSPWSFGRLLDLAGVHTRPDVEPAPRASRIATADLMARAGPSKSAKKPSPAVSTSTPPKSASSRRTVSW